MLKLNLRSSSQSASIVEAKDIGQRSVHILQDLRDTQFATIAKGTTPTSDKPA
jgi:hypothetical protein